MVDNSMLRHKSLHFPSQRRVLLAPHKNISMQIEYRTGEKVNGNVVMTTVFVTHPLCVTALMVSSLHFALSLSSQRNEREFRNERHWLSIAYCPVCKARLDERTDSLKRVRALLHVCSSQWGNGDVKSESVVKCHDDYRERECSIGYAKAERRI